MGLPRDRCCPKSGAVLPRQHLRSVCVHQMFFCCFMKPLLSCKFHRGLVKVWTSRSTARAIGCCAWEGLSFGATEGQGEQDIT